MTLPSSSENGFNSDKLLGAGCSPCRSEVNALTVKEQSAAFLLLGCCSASESLAPGPRNTALSRSAAAGDLHSPHKLLIKN